MTVSSSALPQELAAPVTVIVVNHNGGEALTRCLSALQRQTIRPAEVILVDNASADGSGEEARRLHPHLVYLPQPENLGFAAANNLAAAAASSEWLVLLNPDAYPEPNWIEELLAGAARHPDAVAFGSLQLMADDPSIIDGAGDCLHVLGAPYRGYHGWPAKAAPGEGAILAPCAAAAMYRREAFMALGGFDESFFCYCEDVDLGLRLFDAYGHAVHLPEAVVHHEGSKITGRTSDFTIYHGNRNRIWAWAKNAPSLLFWGLLPAHLLLHVYLLFRFSSQSYASAYGRGLRDGLRAVPRLRRKRKRRGARFAPMLVWSLRALTTRRGKVRSLT